MNSGIRLFWILMLMLIPTLAGAASIDPCGGKDCSLFYLGQLFGNVGTVLLTGSTGVNIMGDIFRIFNLVVLSLGSVVVGYSIALSTISTAHEGEVMGKKWSSIWIPIRAATGLSFLVPTANGYCFVQILMMWVIVQGINGANLIWKTILDSASGTYSLNTKVTTDDTKAKDLATQLFTAFTCISLYNNDPTYTTDQGTVTVYQPSNKTDELWIGVDGGNSDNRQICGKIKAASFNTTHGQDETTWDTTQLNAAWMAYYTTITYANEAATSSKSGWTGTDVDMAAKNAIQSVIANTALKSSDPSKSLSLALSQGWVYAGLYYFTLSEDGIDVKLSVPTFTSPNTTISTKWNTAEANATAYLSGTKSTATANLFSTSPFIVPSVDDTNLQELLKAITEPLSVTVKNWQKNLQDDSESTPIKAFQERGHDFMQTAERMFWGTMGAAVVVMLIAAVAASFNPSFLSILALVTILVPALMVVVGLLWTAGVFMGIYLPLLPFLVFTFTALGFLLLCIESMAAAPIVALGITSPGQDALGKASPAVMILTNLYLRPSLMLIGFVAAARLLSPMLTMINDGFNAMMMSVSSNLMVFGSIAAVVMYVGIITTAMHQIFSLIHVLPDRVTMWIGGQAENAMVEKAIQESKRASEKGGQVSQELMKGAAEQITSGAKQMQSSGGKGGEGVKPDQGGGGGGVGLGGEGGSAPPMPPPV